ncbi:helix-turn-helix domain-containing protein [Altererythrobacter sp. Root672]|uniref:helix-turn-helix domain-containing protein n=1 Tax=Altererythrobacter sp. Root672 TaxID=1736584 RepID=UPI0007018013|nr:helix-turn-helix domain-containing protein [Altererythrobacter sp. Root672]KRA81622.1 excisionase [Altererythrobacter sp. Root672]
MEPITITIADAKKATGLGVTTIYDLIGQGKLETVKVGRRTLVKTKSIRVLLGEAA